NFFFYTRRLPPTSTLFPYTTLFRSIEAELALLRQPVVAVSDVNPASSQGTFALAKNGPPKPTGPTVQTTAPVVPDEVAPLARDRSEEHTSELQSQSNLVCRLLLEKK